MAAISQRLRQWGRRRPKQSDSAETRTLPAAPTDIGHSCVSEHSSPDTAVVEAQTATGSVAATDPAARGCLEPKYGLALIAGTGFLVALGATAGWLGYQTLIAQRLDADREHYVQAARQTALDLTTIDYTHVEADVQRILDGATGEFRDGFSERAQPFIDTAKRARSRSAGTVTQAGLESMAGGQAQAIVAVTVTTTDVSGATEAPKSWRLRLGMQTVGDSVKVSQVEFVQ